MKKKKRKRLIQFYVDEWEEKQIHANMQRNGMTNRGEYLRILALAKSEISFSVKVPNVSGVSEARLGSIAEEARPLKRAVG